MALITLLPELHTLSITAGHSGTSKAPGTPGNRGTPKPLGAPRLQPWVSNATAANRGTPKPLGTPRLQPWVSNATAGNGASAPGACLPQSRRLSTLTFSLFLLLPLRAHPQTPEPPTVRIAVLTLFHPRTLLLSTHHPTTIQLDHNPTPLTQPATIQSTPEGLTLNHIPAQTLTLSGTFTLTVPNKLTRTYTGTLTVESHKNTLLALIDLPTEAAVASIVAAEAPPHAPLEALKAQAIASRSFLLANLHAHPIYDACDTTHCQFLREAPPSSSPAARATALTTHQVLTWLPGSGRPTIVRAMYSRSCGGHTHPHPGANPADYPFYSVTCAYCLAHPDRWTPTGPTPLTEHARIAYNRTHGWSAIPSLTPGTGTGHGVGLCQLGAADLATKGQTAPQILAHFFPNTTLTTIP